MHHILGVEKGDRIWNCVALCPNCHRDAHYSPDEPELNRQLLAYNFTNKVVSLRADRLVTQQLCTIKKTG
ncbi:HNH endonuclease signature motif containing protein [Burkholderia ubonensis]|uniref:HNH endonuclease signature motif containing protein n=1 Tax=Burkholderia ubonensis TaxID=101571 RepID=UPI001E2B3738|nr:HNH endonuclease signature motif containing protein [Burkholderia ubonensis]